MKLSRRNFLVAAAVGGVASMPARKLANPGQAAKPATQYQTAGYEASAHVRKYYRTAKV
jgi:hypothetical protein